MSLRQRWLTLVQIAYDLFLKLNPRKLSAHAVITDEDGNVLLLRSRYAGRWSLPGGGLGRGEHLDTALLREVREELGVQVTAERLSGVYFHARNSTYIAIFCCQITAGSIRLSHEHAEYRWQPMSRIPEPLRQMVADALAGSDKSVLRTFA